MNRRAVLVLPFALWIESAMGKERTVYGYAPNVAPDYVSDMIPRALAAWGLPWRYVRKAQDNNPGFKGSDVVIFVAPGKDRSSVTTYSQEGGAKIRIIDDTTDYPDYTYNNLLHELGHAMGLEHTKEPDSVMNPSALIMPLAPSSRDLQRAHKKLGIAKRSKRG